MNYHSQLIKKYLFWLLVIIVLVVFAVLARKFYPRPDQQVDLSQSALPEEVVQVATGESENVGVELALSWDNDELTKEIETETASLPPCQRNLSPDVEIISINDMVKNCSIKKKTAIAYRGLWWGAIELYIYNNTLVEWNFKEEGVCILDNEFYEKSSTDTYHRNIIDKIVNKGLLSSIVLSAMDYPYYLECKDDADCSIISEPRTDWVNYFVDWYREKTYWDYYFVINDKLFNPKYGEATYSYWGEAIYNYWDFAGIKDWKIIVKRRLNQEDVYENKNDEIGTSTFDIETCEIDL